MLVITDPQATYGYPQELHCLPQGQQHIPLAYAHPIPMPSSTPYFLAPTSDTYANCLFTATFSSH